MFRVPSLRFVVRMGLFSPPDPVVPPRRRLRELAEGTPVWAVQWDAEGGVLRFWTADGYFEPFPPGAAKREPAAVLDLVRQVRAEYPPEMQDGWPAFCRRVALPLVRCDRPGRPLRPFERVAGPFWLTPRAAAVPLILQGFGLLMWATGGGRGWVAVGGVAAGVVAVGKWWSRRRGVSRILAECPPRPFLTEARDALLCLAACVVGVSGMGLAVVRAGNPWWGLPALLPGAILALHLARVEQTRTAAFESERDAEAAEEWDALHADPQREPRWWGEL